ncbi:MAG: hypothetical protein HY331_09860 [Chloroflexi bacterium]|nr:hypothetical protein [Chloroflexota bacterium]
MVSREYGGRKAGWLPRTVAAVGLTAVLALAGCGAAPRPDATAGQTSAATPEGKGSAAAAMKSEGDRSAALTQTSEAGQVTIQATWAGPDAGPVFVVVMDTHAVDLDGYDLRQLSVLRTGQGRDVSPTGWDAPKDGHHRSGNLTFPATADDGSPVLGPGPQTVELIIRNVAGVPERTFRWKL